MSDEEFSKVELCRVDKGKMTRLPEVFRVKEWKLPSAEFNRVLAPNIGVAHKRLPLSPMPGWAGGNKPKQALPPAAAALSQGSLSIRN